MHRVDWAHLCDHAFFDESRKLCLIGIFRAIAAGRVPAVHSNMSLAFHVAGGSDEAVGLKVQVVRPDGRDPLLELENPKATLSKTGEFLAVLGVRNITLPDFGPYEVHISVNGKVVKTTRFEVVRATHPEAIGDRQ